MGIAFYFSMMLKASLKALQSFFSALFLFFAFFLYTPESFAGLYGNPCTQILLGGLNVKATLTPTLTRLMAEPKEYYETPHVERKVIYTRGMQDQCANGTCAVHAVSETLNVIAKRYTKSGVELEDSYLMGHLIYRNANKRFSEIRTEAVKDPALVLSENYDPAVSPDGAVFLETVLSIVRDHGIMTTETWEPQKPIAQWNLPGWSLREIWKGKLKGLLGEIQDALKSSAKKMAQKAVSLSDSQRLGRYNEEQAVSVNAKFRAAIFRYIGNIFDDQKAKQTRKEILPTLEHKAVFVNRGNIEEVLVAIARMVDSGLPVPIGLKWPPETSIREFPRLPKYVLSPKNTGVGLLGSGTLHAVSVIGYDVNPLTNEVVGLVVKNSWGDSAGYHGHYIITKEYLQKYMDDNSIQVLFIALKKE